MRLNQPEPPADVVAAPTGSISGNFNDTGSRDRGGGGGKVVELAEVKGHGLLLERPVADESGASLLLRVMVVGQPVPNLSPLSLTS